MLKLCETAADKMPILVILYDDKPIGVNLVNQIVEGESALFHAHIWNPNFRRKGLSPFTYPHSSYVFMERFNLKKIIFKTPVLNIGALKVKEKLGLKSLGLTKLELPFFDKPVDANIFEWTREECLNVINRKPWLKKYSNIQLREPNESEFKKIAKFSFENFVVESAKSSGKSVDELKSYLGNTPDQIYENDIWRVVELSGVYIGFIWVKLSPKEKTAFGYDIFLQPEFRSKGIGRIVMNKIGDEVKNLGYSSVTICVFEENKIARALYESLGFEVVKFDESRRQFHLQIKLSKI